MPIPSSSADYYRRQQRIVATLLLAVRRVWRRMEPGARWSEQYADDRIGAQLLMLVGAAQVAAARDADTYIAEVLAELGLAADAAPGLLVPAAFAGVAGDGRPVETLLAQAVPYAGRSFTRKRDLSSAAEELERPDWMSDPVWESVERERTTRVAEDRARNIESAAAAALVDAGRWLEMAAATAVIDAARAAESAATTARPEVSGYVRMLNPPSCSRCVVLAGRFYRWNDGFRRHPLCDCRHIPSSEALAGDMTVDPDAYFHSLSPVEQDKVFTQAGAQAIRDGADLSQVVNARRGMEKAQVYGRQALITREGVTRRGQYGQSRGGFEKQRGRRYQASKHVRLMPESIYDAAAGDRDEAVRLLKLHGFVTP